MQGKGISGFFEIKKSVGACSAFPTDFNIICTYASMFA